MSGHRLEKHGARVGRLQRRAIRTAMAALVSSMAAGAASAQAPTQPPTTARSGSADRREFEAKRACASGQAQRGVELLAEYYAETGDTVAIYNQGRCYQQNDMPGQAIARFREYLRVTKNLPRERRKETERFIQELEADRARKDAERATAPVSPAVTGVPAAPPPEAAGPALPAAPGAFPPAGAPADMAPPPPQGHYPAPSSPYPPSPRTAAGPPVDTTRMSRGNAGSALRVTGIVLGGVAAAGLATGIYFSTRVSSLENDIENAGKTGPPASYRSTQDQLDAGSRAQTLQWVGYGVAAAAAGGSILCLVLSSRNGGERRPLALGGGEGRPPAPLALVAPLIGPSAVGGTLHLVF